MRTTASHELSGTGKRSVKVLFLASNPASSERLRIDREARQIRGKLLATTHASRVEIVSRWAVGIDDLLQALMEVQPEIVHFSGHGTRSQQIVLEDGAGGDAPIDTSALAGVFGVLKDRIGLVVLNACYSRPQAQAINEHIDCTIGMGQSLSGEASLEFSAIFYQAIGFGRSIQTAFDLACKILECKRIPGADIPQLFVRPTVDPRDVILVHGQTHLALPSPLPAVKTGGLEEHRAARDGVATSRGLVDSIAPTVEEIGLKEDTAGQKAASVRPPRPSGSGLDHPSTFMGEHARVAPASQPSTCTGTCGALDAPFEVLDEGRARVPSPRPIAPAAGPKARSLSAAHLLAAMIVGIATVVYLTRGTLARTDALVSPAEMIASESTATEGPWSSTPGAHLPPVSSACSIGPPSEPSAEPCTTRATPRGPFSPPQPLPRPPQVPHSIPPISGPLPEASPTTGTTPPPTASPGSAKESQPPEVAPAQVIVPPEDTRVSKGAGKVEPAEEQSPDEASDPYEEPVPKEEPMPASGSADCTAGFCSIRTDQGIFRHQDQGQITACLGDSATKCPITYVPAEGRLAGCMQNVPKDQQISGKVPWKKCP